MLLEQAINLIKTSIITNIKSSVWTDLGCGTDLFTNALAFLLADNSTVYAIDKSKQNIGSGRSVNINFIQLDFVQSDLKLPLLDGIMMANSLHYVKDKYAFLNRISAYIKPNGKLLIVEYDRTKANPWMPFPINFYSVQNLLNNTGFQDVIKISERPSAFGSVNMYSCIAVKSN